MNIDSSLKQYILTSFPSVGWDRSNEFMYLGWRLERENLKWHWTNWDRKKRSEKIWITFDADILCIRAFKTVAIKLSSFCTATVKFFFSSPFKRVKSHLCCHFFSNLYLWIKTLNFIFWNLLPSLKTWTEVRHFGR